ncbi:ankyrin repeat domain-containing protein [Wolbachia endosymbiont of Pentalonia nigronervosa]|jgi:ankyrin repeat protein|uniref:ankyrin repeat domain-containing protein n=1 Tax=Wolbachia endosymbiont of Pentalonia nigronervosa TaxID=1301914 RepID=UPI00165FC447|nr:ankyrin repeat domain-containing protein [Wolbachia endosymbiont of Pentalonia nigronervosa]MBD0391595.1 ankyrin repeat domain-containing protein [Wolbachia endosymbiont of Pentalonia nigronervosa]
MQSNKNNYIKPPLHQAAENNEVDVMRGLLKKEGGEEDVDVNAVEDRNKETALHFAAGFGHIEAVEFLLAAGADIDAKNKYDETPLYCASRDHRDYQGHHMEVTKILLNNGADAKVVSKFGYTPLHWWARRGHIDIIRDLLAAGVGVNVANDYGDTALHWAAKRSYRGVVMILLVAGADPSLMNKYSQTPIDLVQTPGIEEIFRDAGTILQKMREEEIGKSGISPCDIILANEANLIRYAHDADVYQWLQGQFYYYDPLEQGPYGDYTELICSRYQTINGRICIANDASNVIAQPNTQLDATQTAGGSGLSK